MVTVAITLGTVWWYQQVGKGSPEKASLGLVKLKEIQVFIPEIEKMLGENAKMRDLLAKIAKREEARSNAHSPEIDVELKGFLSKP